MPRIPRLMVVCALVAAALALASCLPPASETQVRRLAPDDSQARLERLVAPRPLVIPADARLLQRRPLDVSGLLDRTIAHGPAAGRMVAITMDDGPSAESSAVLDIVERTATPVTFFYCGRRVLTAPTEARRAVALGCELGDHTTSHIELVGLPSAEVRKEITETRDIIRRVAGVAPVWVRPRSGASDTLARKVIASEGMALVLWSVYPRDTIPSPPPHSIARRVLAQVRPGSIILLHETNPKTVAALSEIIAGLRSRGYTPVTLSTLLAAEAKAARKHSPSRRP